MKLGKHILLGVALATSLAATSAHAELTKKTEELSEKPMAALIDCLTTDKFSEVEIAITEAGKHIMPLLMRVKMLQGFDKASTEDVDVAKMVLGMLAQCSAHGEELQRDST